MSDGNKPPSPAECEAIAAQSISDWAIEQHMERTGLDWHESYLALLNIRTRAFTVAAEKAATLDHTAERGEL